MSPSVTFTPFDGRDFISSSLKMSSSAYLNSMCPITDFYPFFLSFLSSSHEQSRF